MNPPRRSLLGALGLLLACGALAGTLSGCSSAGATLDPVAQAADVTSAAGDVQMAFSMRMSISALSSPLTATGSGSFDYRAHEGQIALAMAGLPAAATAALGSGELHIEELFKSGAVYVRSPLFAGHLPNGARWLKFDAAKLAGGLDAADLMSGESNPAQFLEYLRERGGTVTTVGSETLAGVQTTHYRGAIDVSEALHELPSSERATAQAALKQAGLSSIPFDVWVDGQHRVRRMQTSLSMSLAGQPASLQMTIDFSGYGSSTPPIRAPAASEVAELPSALPSLGA